MGSKIEISRKCLNLIRCKRAPYVSRTPVPSGKKVIDIAHIRSSLNDIKAHFPEINEQLKPQRELFSDKILDNLVSGYEHLNSLFTASKELESRKFEPRELEPKDIFDMNLKALMGNEFLDYIEYNGVIINNQNLFCKGIGSLWKWYKNNLTASPWKKAAGVYVRLLSHPQLFFEGNHRTAALLVCYIFVNEGLQPFVLNPKNAVYFLNLSSQIKFSTKNLGFKLHVSRLTRYQKELEGFLMKNYPPES